VGEGGAGDVVIPTFAKDESVQQDDIWQRRHREPGRFRQTKPAPSFGIGNTVDDVELEKTEGTCRHYFGHHLSRSAFDPISLFTIPRDPLHLCPCYVVAMFSSSRFYQHACFILPPLTCFVSS
jgi:hypothetical protein